MCEGVKEGKEGERRVKEDLYIYQQLNYFFPYFTRKRVRAQIRAYLRPRAG